MADVLVLCYHALSATWPADLAAHPDAFAEQIRMLADRGYRGATFSQALNAPPAGRTVAITFDDAYHSVYELAAPILEDVGWPATVYVPTGWAGRREPMRWDGIEHWSAGAHADELRCLSWHQLGELQERGWEIGSHTCTHPRLTLLQDADLMRELVESRTEIETQLGGPCRSIAYPYGNVDERVIAAASRAGYENGAGLPERIWAPRTMDWPRVGVYRPEPLARVARRTTRWWRWLERSPAWRPVRLAGRLRAAVRGRGSRVLPGYPPLLGATVRTSANRVLSPAAGLAGRLGFAETYVAWPTLDRPQLVLPTRDPAPADWLISRFDPEGRRPAVIGAATWSALRARGALQVGRPERGMAARAAALALARPLVRPVRCAVYSASSEILTKKIAFVWEGRASEPAVVVKMAGHPGLDGDLRHEVSALEAIRSRAAGTTGVVQALPARPLWSGELDGRFVTVEPVDDLGGQLDPPPRELALEWLRRFHAATALPPQPWDAEEDDRAAEVVALAWHVGGLGNPAPVLRALRRALEIWRSRPMAVHAVHGDFWLGNLAAGPGVDIRVFDWEWAEERGRPILDLLTLSVGGPEPVDLPAVRAEIEQELSARGQDPEVARLLLLPALAELAMRWRRRANLVSGVEPRLLAVLPEAAALIPPA